MKHAVFCATRNLYGDMEAAAKSLVANSDVDKVHFLIEDAEFPRPLPDIIECHDVSGQRFFSNVGPNAFTSWTWMVLMRAALCHVLPDVDKVLSLDCDAFCVRDASGIWNADLDGKYFAGVAELAKSKPGEMYVNFGVVLFNLAKLRDGKADDVISALNSRKFQFPEQDAMNQLCKGCIEELPPEYCAMSFNVEIDDPCIVHYAGMKRDEWRKNPEASVYFDMTWEEAMEKHETEEYKGKPVLFTSDHTLTRAENLRAVWGACKLPKRFVRDTRKMSEAARQGYAAVVCDTFPRWMHDKGDCKLITIGHGFAGCKIAGVEEKRPGIDTNAFKQIDVLVCQSEDTIPIVAHSYGVDEGRVKPLGMPRTDAYFGKKKGDGDTFMRRYRRAYFYAPTYRGPYDGDKLPGIDWAALDEMLEDDEIVVVKRHYFQHEPIVKHDVERIAEVVPSEASAPYLIDCDVLITDYSSIVVDGYLLGKPSVLTVDDADAYLHTRGMSYEYPQSYSSRWLVAGGNEEKLLAMLREAAENGMGEVERACAKRLAGACDGNSANRVVELIKNML